MKFERKNNTLIIKTDGKMLRLMAMDDAIVRITYTEKEKFSDEEKPGVIMKGNFEDWKYEEAEDSIIYKSDKLRLEISKEGFRIKYFDENGKKLLEEKGTSPRSLERFEAYIIEDAKIEKILTADGEKERVIEAKRVPNGEYYHTRLNLTFSEDEVLYGLGQHEDGYVNLRGKTIYGHQANKKIVVPYLVSSKGYGILFDTYSPFIFTDGENGGCFYTEADCEQDYYFVNGEGLSGGVRGYRRLTGKASLLPKWALGYVQSRERYTDEKMIMDTVKEFSERKIPLDCIVLDWMSWPDGEWGQKSFDYTRFPNPTAMIEKLHSDKLHFMISIWPNMDPKCPNYKEFKEKGLFLPGSNIYNAFSKEARELYWEQIKKGLYSHGIDAWWCDSSEPYSPEWDTGSYRMGDRECYDKFVEVTGDHISIDKGNAYSIYHAMSCFEGEKREGNDRRLVNLTRSGITGQQRYNTILWSGDVAASWNALKRQVPAGMQIAVSGMPYWTVDAGAFFVKDRRCEYHFMDGEYTDTLNDPGFRELYVRWLQWCAFLPVFRSHGTDCPREPWQFGEGLFYNAIVETIKLRYSLMPYIYSCAGMMWLKDEAMIRFLGFDFPEDKRVWEIGDQYMFGDAIMVCPVTEALFFDHNREMSEKEKGRWVYLPKGTAWYDFYTDKRYEGGETIFAEAPMNRIPLFVKEGSIVPMAKPSLRAEECNEITLNIYSGRDCSYELYEDDGNGHGYEKGEYTINTFKWDDRERTLTQTGREYEYIVK